MRETFPPKRCPSRACFFIVASLAVATHVVAEDVLMQASGARQSGRWAGLEQGKIEFQQKDRPLDAVALEDAMWLRLSGDPPQRDAKSAPHTVNLVGAGSAQGLVKVWDERHLQLETKALGVLRIPISLVKSVQWARGARLAEVAEDDVLQVRTANGSLQSLKGKVFGIRDGALGFRYQGQDRRVKLTSLVRADLVREPAKNNRPQLAVNWWPLSRTPINAVKRTPNGSTELTTVWGQTLKGRFRGASFSVINGRAVLLSALEPSKVEHTPYFDVQFPHQSQAPPGGWRLAGVSYTQGLMTHSRTVLTYEMDQSYDSLHATVGIEDSVGKLGNADVQIRVNGEAVSQWTAEGGQTPKLVEVGLQGAKELTLIVDFGEDQDVGDRVVWGNARLLRAAKQ